MRTTDIDLPNEMRERAAEMGHAELTEGAGSYGRTWLCTRCGGRVERLASTWTGWAVEYTCARVLAVAEPTGRRVT